MRKYTVILFFLLFGCELIVDVDVPYSEALTLNSFFTPDSVWNVKLTANRFVLSDDAFRKIENGVVIVYENDLPIETLKHVGNGNYRSSGSKPLLGRNYEIKATVENLGTVTGHSLAPLPTQISNVEFTKEEAAFGNPPTVKFKLKFKDPQNISNYYQITVDNGYIRYNQSTGQESIDWSPTFIESDDPIFQQENEGSNGSLVFKDILFNGKDTELTFKANNVFNGNLRVRLKTLSEDHYKYLTTSQLQQSTSGDPFAQPTNVFNNIKNGYGIFAGHSESVYEYHAPRPVITGFTPARGRAGDRITINGENFNTNGYVTVYFQGRSNTLFYAYPLLPITETQIVIQVPQGNANGPTTGPITIYTPGGKVTSAMDFEILQ